MSMNPINRNTIAEFAIEGILLSGGQLCEDTGIWRWKVRHVDTKSKGDARKAAFRSKARRAAYECEAYESNNMLMRYEIRGLNVLFDPESKNRI